MAKDFRALGTESNVEKTTKKPWQDVIIMRFHNDNDPVLRYVKFINKKYGVPKTELIRRAILRFKETGGLTGNDQFKEE